MSNVGNIKSLLDAKRDLVKIRAVIKKIEDDAIRKYKEKLSEDKSFVNTDDYDLATDKFDDNGVRRFTIKNSKDGFIMIPDSEGYWVPYNDDGFWSST